MCPTGGILFLYRVGKKKKSQREDGKEVEKTTTPGTATQNGAQPIAKKSKISKKSGDQEEKFHSYYPYMKLKEV